MTTGPHFQVILTIVPCKFSETGTPVYDRSKMLVCQRIAPTAEVVEPQIALMVRDILREWKPLYIGWAP